MSDKEFLQQVKTYAGALSGAAVPNDVGTNTAISVAAQISMEKWRNEIRRCDGRIEELENALRKIAMLNNKRDRFSSEIDDLIIKALGEAK